MKRPFIYLNYSFGQQDNRLNYAMNDKEVKELILIISYNE